MSSPDRKQISAAEFAMDIRLFIDGHASVLDYDDFVTFELSDARLELARKECLEVLLDKPHDRIDPWQTEEGRQKLLSIYRRIIDPA